MVGAARRHLEANIPSGVPIWNQGTFRCPFAVLRSPSLISQGSLQRRLCCNRGSTSSPKGATQSATRHGSGGQVKKNESGRTAHPVDPHKGETNLGRVFLQAVTYAVFFSDVSSELTTALDCELYTKYGPGFSRACSFILSLAVSKSSTASSHSGSFSGAPEKRSYTGIFIARSWLGTSDPSSHNNVGSPYPPGESCQLDDSS
jgi:hypothetical protein